MKYYCIYYSFIDKDASSFGFGGLYIQTDLLDFKYIGDLIKSENKKIEEANIISINKLTKKEYYHNIKS